MTNEHMEAKKIEDDSLLNVKSTLNDETFTMDETIGAEAQTFLDEEDMRLLENSAPAPTANHEAPSAKEDDYIGDHLCAKIGEDATKDFVSKDILKKLLEASKEDMGKNFSLDSESVDATMEGQGCGIAMAVSDPLSEDCPLVFVSGGFEDLTGYTADFVVGRSCRFLQPTSKVLNDGINLNERKMMRAFCTEIQPVGTPILNLLLNERKSGERFWNLLRMQYVMVDGHEYIFGVQTTLNAFMPKLLTRRLLGSTKNVGIVDALGDFLHALENMRSEIRSAEFMPILELKGYYTCALNTLAMLPALSRIGGGGDGALNKVLDIKNAGAAAKASCEGNASDAAAVSPGCYVTVDEELKYSTYTVPVGHKGKVLSIDSFGTASIEWKGIGKKGCLKRDISKLRKISELDVESAIAGA